MRTVFIILLGFCFAVPALASDERQEYVDDEGITNPEELTIRSYVKYYDFKDGDHMQCMIGHFAAQAGWDEGAARIFKQCSDGGNEAAMIWLSHAYANGLGLPLDLPRSVELERQAAERGYSIGQYNYGLSLLRGLGVAADIEAGKRWVGKAAEQGDEAANTLINSGFNLDVAIPDADEKKKLW